jgi:hypothetical protein
MNRSFSLTLLKKKEYSIYIPLDMGLALRKEKMSKRETRFYLISKLEIYETLSKYHENSLSVFKHNKLIP